MIQKAALGVKFKKTGFWPLTLIGELAEHTFKCVSVSQETSLGVCTCFVTPFFCYCSLAVLPGCLEPRSLVPSWLGDELRAHGPQSAVSDHWKPWKLCRHCSMAFRRDISALKSVDHGLILLETWTKLSFTSFKCGCWALFQQWESWLIYVLY